jgi:hypothetical protein
LVPLGAASSMLRKIVSAAVAVAVVLAASCNSQRVEHENRES